MADSIVVNEKTNKKKVNYYETFTYIMRRRLKKTDSTLRARYKVNLTQLSKESKGEIALSDSAKTALELSLVVTSDSMNILAPQIDSLYNEYLKEFLQYRSRTILSFGTNRSRAFFDILYEKGGKNFNVLNNTGFNFGNKSGSIYSELVSGNLAAFRVALGAMVSASSSDSVKAKEEEAYQRLVAYGGNTVLTMEYPLAYIHSKNNQANFISRLIIKGTSDFPEFGTTTEDWAGSFSVGLNMYADAALTNNQIRFFGNFNLNWINGTDLYQENLGVDESRFSFGQLTVGLVFNQNIKLSFIVSTFSSEESLRNRNVVVGGQILN